LLVVGGIPILAGVSVNDSSPAVRKKAILALSSGIRNYQPALNEALKHLPAEFKDGDGEVDASNMEAIDSIIGKLRDASAKKAEAQ
jgi:hsp70-interacting protein